MKKGVVIFGLCFLFLSMSFISAECIDSDGGRDYFVAGVVTSNSESFSDYCESFAGGNLIEYYCSGDTVSSESYGECSEGCSEGACITLEETCTDECSTIGVEQCFGTGYKECNNHDSDTCLEWGSLIYCPSGQECLNGICIPSTPSCKSTKQSCSINSDCCSSLICEKDICCKSSGNSCFSNSECCSGNLCINNSCAKPPVCKNSGQSCETNNDCCSGLMCENFAGGSNTCIANCESSGESCTSYADCCLGLTCKNNFCCKSSGQSCEINNDCCSGLICENWAEGSKTCIYNYFSNITSSTTPDAEELPAPALSQEQIINYNTELKTSQINTITLEVESERLIYSISGIKEGRLFAIIPVSAKVEQKIDANSGDIISTRKPWWSFLASGI